MPNYMKQEPLAVLHFESFTPLWPGGPINASTYYCTNTGHCIGPFFPDAKQLIGRIRWLLRTIEASLLVLQGKQVSSYKEVDRLSAKIFGNLNAASKVRVELSFDASSARNYLDLKTLRDLDRKLKSKGINIGSSAIQSMEVDGYNRLRQRLGINANIEPTKGEPKWYKNLKRYMQATRNGNDVPDELVLLMTIPRIRLALQGARSVEEIYMKQPLRGPKIDETGIRLTISLYPRSGATLSPGELELLVLALTFTLTFMGLGKATTRGFGRFKLIEYTLNKTAEKLSNILDVLRKTTNSSKEMLKSHQIVSGALLNQAKTLLGISLSSSILEPNDEDPWSRIQSLTLRSRVPLFITSYIFASTGEALIDELKHPCPYATPQLPLIQTCKRALVNDVLSALSAVGNATLKATWKMQYGSQMLKQPGVAFHTWPLGLPRGVQSRGTRTGYYMVEQPFSGESCGSRLTIRVKKETRRLSSVFFTVACNGGRCFGLVQPYLSNTDYAARMNKFIHIGIHNARSKNKLFHIVNVAYALQQKRLGHGGCPRDLAGLVLPPSNIQGSVISSSVNNAKMIVWDPIRAALEWITYLLR